MCHIVSTSVKTHDRAIKNFLIKLAPRCMLSAYDVIMFEESVEDLNERLET